MYFEFRIDYLDYKNHPTTKYKCISDVYDAKRNISIIYQYKDWIKAHQDYMTKYYFLQPTHNQQETCFIHDRLHQKITYLNECS